MLVKRIAYETYDGDRIEENFYFNLTKSETMTLQVSKDGGFEQFLKRIIDAHSGKEIMNTVSDIILTAYGEKSPDGKQLMKSPEIRSKFECSPAYDELFCELCVDDQKMAEFIKAVIPDDMEEFVEKMNKRAAEAEAKGLKVIEGSVE